MTQKEIVQEIYRNARIQSNRETQTCLDFIKWLHEEKGEAHYLKDMDDLNSIERSYLDQLLRGELD